MSRAASVRSLARRSSSRSDSARHAVKGRDFTIAIADGTPERQGLAIVVERLLRFAPKIEGTSIMVERYRLTEPITEGRSHLERTFKKLDCFLLLTQSAIRSPRVREDAAFGAAIATLSNYQQRLVQMFERLLRVANHVENVS